MSRIREVEIPVRIEKDVFADLAAKCLREGVHIEVAIRQAIRSWIANGRTPNQVSDAGPEKGSPGPSFNDS